MSNRPTNAKVGGAGAELTEAEGHADPEPHDERDAIEPQPRQRKDLIRSGIDLRPSSGCVIALNYIPMIVIAENCAEMAC
jgi:hypothetical protein